MRALAEAAESMRDDGVRLVLSNPSRAVVAQLARSAVLDIVGAAWIFVQTADAVEACLASRDTEADAAP